MICLERTFQVSEALHCKQVESPHLTIIDTFPSLYDFNSPILFFSQPLCLSLLLLCLSLLLICLSALLPCLSALLLCLSVLLLCISVLLLCTSLAMADFNSSDIEISDQESDGPRVGRKAIASILEKSVVDRIESKKKVKKLRDVSNAPSTAIHRQYWHELFKQFAQHTLHIDSRPE